MRIHLMAYNPTPQATPRKNRPYMLPGLIEDLPICRVRLRLSTVPRGVAAANPSTKIRYAGQAIDAVIEDVHEVVIVEY